jgi:ankyrin repeat protein
MQYRLARLAPLGVAFVLAAGSPAAARDSKVADAARQRARTTVVTLIQQGADVNAPQADGATALHWAAHWDDGAMADDLLRAGADPNAANDYGVTPLTLASTNGSALMIARLLTAGARPDTMLPSGETALMTAARVGRPDAVRLLLAADAPVGAKEQLKGQTALMWAVSEGHAEVARLLIDKGADVNAASNTGFTPLMFAARQGDREMATLLLDRGARIDESTADGTTPLLVATVRGHAQLAMHLLDRGAAVEGDFAAAGFTPLHWAVGKWETQTTRDYPDAGGEWHSLIGVREGKAELIKALLARGADVNARTVKSPPRFGFGLAGAVKLSGATPFWLASMAADVSVMKLLLANGADPLARNSEGVTPLMVAAGVGRSLNDSAITESDSIAAALLCLALGNDVNAKSESNGFTALHGSAYFGMENLARVLGERGADLDARTKNGQTALELADGAENMQMFLSHPKVVEVLKQLAAAKASANR